MKMILGTELSIFIRIYIIAYIFISFWGEQSECVQDQGLRVKHSMFTSLRHVFAIVIFGRFIKVWCNICISLIVLLGKHCPTVHWQAQVIDLRYNKLFFLLTKGEVKFALRCSFDTNLTPSDIDMSVWSQLRINCGRFKFGNDDGCMNCWHQMSPYLVRAPLCHCMHGCHQIHDYWQQPIRWCNICLIIALQQENVDGSVVQ